MLDKRGIEYIRECLKAYKNHLENRTVSNIAGDFFTYVMKGYEKPVKKSKQPSYANFEQRDYSEDYFEKFYATSKTDKKNDWST